MNGYQLSRRWWDWCFRHSGQFSPAHTALYTWYVEACNRAEWPSAFEMAPQYAMTAIGIRSYNTYKDTLSDLQAWGFVRVRRKGQNQYVPWLLALSNFDEPLNEPNDVALSNFDIPLNKARNKAVDNPRDAFTINNKPVNLKTYKQKKEGAKALFWSVLKISDGVYQDRKTYESFVKAEKKKKPLTPVPPPPSPEFPPTWSVNMMAIYGGRWLAFRQTGPFKKLKLNSIQTQINLLSDLNEEQLIACIDYSISNGYQGLFPDKFKTNGYANGSSYPSKSNGRNPGVGSQFGAELDAIINQRYGPGPVGDVTEGGYAVVVDDSGGSIF